AALAERSRHARRRRAVRKRPRLQHVLPRVQPRRFADAAPAAHLRRRLRFTVLDRRLYRVARDHDAARVGAADDAYRSVAVVARQNGDDEVDQDGRGGERSQDGPVRLAGAVRVHRRELTMRGWRAIVLFFAAGGCSETALQYGKSLADDPGVSDAASNAFRCTTCHDFTQAPSGKLRPGYTLFDAASRPTRWGGFD